MGGGVWELLGESDAPELYLCLIGCGGIWGNGGKLGV